MKKVLTENNQVLEIKNNERLKDGQKAILEYTHEDTGYVKLIFKYGPQVFVFQSGAFMYASQDEEPSHDLTISKVIIDMETPYSRLEKQAYEVAKKEGVLLWQALGKEEPKEKIIIDSTPLYSDNMTIEEYNKNTTNRDCWKPTEFEEWQVKQPQKPFTQDHKNFSLMDVVYWRNDYGVEFTSRIVGFSENGLFLSCLDIGGESYWSPKCINRYKIRKATLQDIFRTSKQYEYEKYNISNLDQFAAISQKHPRNLETVFSNGMSVLLRGGDRFLSYCEGDVLDYDVAWYSADTYTKACIQFEKEYN